MNHPKLLSASRRAVIALGALLAISCSRAAPAPAPAFDGPRDVPLVTHHHEQVRLRDQIRGKVVLIHFMFTTCNGVCPLTTKNLAKVQEQLGDHLGRDVFIESISLDPEVDTPDVLARYAQGLGAKPGWTFFTGRRDDIDLLRRGLGLYERDPVVDADKTKHSGVIVYGNEATGTWSAMSGLAKPEAIVESVLRLLRTPGAPETRRAMWKP
jgi:protein SCO1